MATITPGSTIAAITLESALPALIWLIQDWERDATKNPNQINNITSSNSDDDSSMEATVNINCNLSTDADGKVVITPIEYLTLVSADFNKGSGTLKGATALAQLIEVFILIRNKELGGTSTNPGSANYINWSVASQQLGSTGQGIFTGNLTGFPLEYTRTAAGGKTLIGKAYLV